MYTILQISLNIILGLAHDLGDFAEYQLARNLEDLSEFTGYSPTLRWGVRFLHKTFFLKEFI